MWPRSALDCVKSGFLASEGPGSRGQPPKPGRSLEKREKVPQLELHPQMTKSCPHFQHLLGEGQEWESQGDSSAVRFPERNPAAGPRAVVGLGCTEECRNASLIFNSRLLVCSLGDAGGPGPGPGPGPNCDVRTLPRTFVFSDTQTHCFSLWPLKAKDDTTNAFTLRCGIKQRSLK